jgi:hypothetical protein
LVAAPYVLQGHTCWQATHDGRGYKWLRTSGKSTCPHCQALL